MGEENGKLVFLAFCFYCIYVLHGLLILVSLFYMDMLKIDVKIHSFLILVAEH